MANKANISILGKSDCCGCRACGDACPTSCISFTEDLEGFIYPQVNASACISCGKCTSICPELNVNQYQKADKAIAAYAETESARQAGSSGGIFGLLAIETINNGGVVYGAAFDDSLQLHHVRVAYIDSIKRILRSKYLQSNPSEIYKQVIADLKSGLKVLFSGTPCQCNAVRNIAGEKLVENLYTVEVVCHGVPSQSLFDKSIKWLGEQKGGRVTSFTFRSKYPKALHPQAFSYTYIRGTKEKTVNGLHYQFPFYFGFQKYITLRPSCYSCKWAKPERTADITLGDFWGIEKYDSRLDAKSGVSQIIINTPKGQRLFKRVTDKHSIFAEEFPIEIAIENNGCLSAPTVMKPSRVLFFDALDTQPFDNVVKKYLTPRRKWIFDIYYGLPQTLRKIVRKIMDKRMKYE